MGELWAGGDVHAPPGVDYLLDVPVGYKRTEVGVIPDDWTAITVREIAPLQRVFDLPTQQVRTGPYPVVYSNGVLRYHDRAMAKAPGVVTGRSGTIGKVHFVTEDYWPHNTALWVITYHGNDPKFIYYFYAHLGLARFLSGSGVPTLNRNDVHEHLTPLPPLPEQRAIAAVLSDVDELIRSLEALIAKKRAIKQAAIEELLTGRKRLPGFGGEWENRLLRDVADCLDHLRVPLNEAQRRQMPGPYPYCGANGVVDHIADYLLDDDVILIAEDGGHFEEHADRPIAYRMTGKIWVNNHAHILMAKSGFSQAFLFYALVHKNILPFLASGTRSKLNRGEMNKIVVHLPRHAAEQRAIATVLSDMDSEITALQQRLDKTRAIKQGMMQQLLTGSIRLPIPADSTKEDANR